MNIQNIGYACINLDVHPCKFKTCRIKNLDKNLHYELIDYNLNVLDKIIDYNINNNVKIYRISSSLIPFATSDLCTLDWKKEFFDKFQKIGNKIKSNNIRISLHLDKHTVINSPKKEVVFSSTKNLEYHIDILEALNMDENSKIILNIGCSYKNKDLAIENFIQNYSNLSKRVKKHLVIENDAKIYNLNDVLNISYKTNIPVVYDNLNHKVNPSLEDLDENEILKKVVSTWKSYERPKIHYSQQAESKPKGYNSQTIDLNKFSFDYENVYKNFNIDIMLEAKDKNRSFKKVDIYINPNQKKLEDEWSRYKYLIMSKSYSDYINIRDLLRNKDKNLVKNFYTLIDNSMEKEKSIKNEINTFEHVWGYFKNKADKKEKQDYFNKLEMLRNGNLKYSDNIGKMLRKLAEKYQQNYILSSYYISQYY